MNHKRSSSALDGTPTQCFASYFQEPPLRKVSNGSSAESMKKQYSSAPMINFLTKYNLINRSQNAFYDILVPEIDMQSVVLPVNPSFRAKSLSSDCLSLNEGISEKKEDEVENMLFESNDSKNSYTRDQINPSEQASQPQLLETRAREESQEYSLFAVTVDVDDISNNDKCNYLTEFQEVAGSSVDEEHKLNEESSDQHKRSQYNSLISAQPSDYELQDELNNQYCSSENNNNINNNSNACDQFRILEFGSF